MDGGDWNVGKLFDCGVKCLEAKVASQFDEGALTKLLILFLRFCNLGKYARRSPKTLLNDSSLLDALVHGQLRN